VRISAVAAQFPVSLTIAENVRHIRAILEQTQPDELLVLPEGAISGYSEDPSFLNAIDLDELDSALHEIQEAASWRGVHLVGGACLRDGDKWRNAALYFAPDGSRSMYCKVNLATSERGVFTAGDKLPVFSMRFADGTATIGVQVCREIRFPEQWRALALQGAQVFAYLTYAASPYAPPGVWRSHLISRGAENQRFVVGANTAHAYRHCPTMIISPRGEVLKEAKVRERVEMIRSVLDLTEVGDWYLDQRRTDVVSLVEMDRGA
jgi:predicted amidohydrolase